MARLIRTRSRVASISGFKLGLRNGTVVSTQPGSFVRTSTCTDFHGRPVIDGTLSSDQHFVGLVLNGKIESKPVFGVADGISYLNYPFTPVMNSVSTAHLVEPSDWYTTAVARSNPSRPVVTPLTLIQDFKELPGQVRHIGDLLNKPAKSLGAKDLANQHLALQFGWLPLVDDLTKLLDLQSHILQRMRELNRLYSSTGLRRRIQLMDDTQSGKYFERQVVNTNCRLDVTHDIEVKRRVWATIHWRPTTPPPSVHQDFSMNKLATQVVSGLTPEGLTKGAWDLVPWTWMINWFVNVGDFLLVNSNTVPAEHSSACLMNEVVVTCSPGPVIPGGNSLDKSDVTLGGAYTYTSKRRSLSGGVVPGFKIPFIGVFRLSILTALFVQRFQR